VLFTKGTPIFPQCGFSAVVVQVLSHLGVEFKGVDVLGDPALRQGIKAFSDWPTVPQLYVKGEFVGGCDIVREMFETGELAQLLASHDADGQRSDLIIREVPARTIRTRVTPSIDTMGRAARTWQLRRCM
jgi:monothiol glutaredoxin